MRLKFENKSEGWVMKYIMEKCKQRKIVLKLILKNGKY